MLPCGLGLLDGGAGLELLCDDNTGEEPELVGLSDRCGVTGGERRGDI